MLRRLNSVHYLWLSVISGILLSLSFTSLGFLLIFIAFVPLFLVVHRFFIGQLKGMSFIFSVLITFLIWNMLSTWWIALASPGGALMAITTNALLMCMVFVLPFMMQKKISSHLNVWWLIPFWLSFEFLHFQWDLMWPWLTLGNVFAFFPYIVQWYEITGISGGSLWILTLNILIFEYFYKHNKIKLRSVLMVLFVPIILSISIYIYRDKELNAMTHYEKKLNVLIVQPNIDPYNEKFYTEPVLQVTSALKQMRSYLNDTLDVIVLPETFITENIYEGNSQMMLHNPLLKLIRDSVVSKYPNINIITGANTFKFYNRGDDIPGSARQNDEGDFYDVFNTALMIYQDSIQVYHKSKLVPGVEKMPYPSLFKPLENFAIDLGGTTGSLGQQRHPSLFYIDNKIPVASVICYESVFSDFVSQFFKMGAKTLFVITNDGWWGNTPGYYQHLMFGKLRAIENRTYISRSANTGVSAIINPLGNIDISTSFWKKDVIYSSIYLSDMRTVFSYTGDIISIISVFFILYLIIYFFVKKLI